MQLIDHKKRKTILWKNEEHSSGTLVADDLASVAANGLVLSAFSVEVGPALARVVADVDAHGEVELGVDPASSPSGNSNVAVEDRV